MKRIFLIAEAGINHDGDLETAKQMASVAKDAGADAVKYQTFWGLDGLGKYEFNESQWVELADYCNSTLGIEFMSTPFDYKSANFLRDLGVKRLKISSGKCRDAKFLRHIANMGKPMVISTGMTTWLEKMEIVNIIQERGMSPMDITLMYCRSIYPTEIHQMHLGNLRDMVQEFDRMNIDVGFSDHSYPMEVTSAILATALGISMYERHFTLDETKQGADHKMAVDPFMLTGIFGFIRSAEEAMTTGPAILPEERELRRRWDGI